jgi:hypothetical protein
MGFTILICETTLRLAGIDWRFHRASGGQQGQRTEAEPFNEKMDHQFGALHGALSL